MKIDTIILSGGSSKGISFLGTFNYLIENQYIDRDLKNIKKIICVSASFLFTLMILFHESDFIQMKKDMLDFNFVDFLDINDISLKNLFNNYGLINKNKNHIYIKKLLKEKYNKENLSLLSLYKKTNIHIIVKVSNITKKKIEYIDHINNPKINILKLIQMTTAMPIIFQPVKYKNDIYIDGGLCGNLPIEINDSVDYLSIDILGGNDENINNIFDYLSKLYWMYTPDTIMRKYDIKNIKLNLDELNIDLTDFNLNNDIKNKLIDMGYEQAKKHFNDYSASSI